MIFRNLMAVGLVAAALLVCSGCGGGGKTLCVWSETTLEHNWGRSFESARYNQIMDPEAEKNLDPVVGLDGPASERVMAGYEKSFEGGQPQQSYTLNLGSIGGIGQ